MYIGKRDPENRRKLFLVSGHMKIFAKELKYVRDWLLSDPVGEDKAPLDMYVPNGKCVETGLQLHRSVLTTSQLEGHHLHLRNSIRRWRKRLGSSITTGEATSTISGGMCVQA
jgi:hypothetical protein